VQALHVIGSLAPPQGLCVTHAEDANRELLAFLREIAPVVAAA
jgi:hypothetical protein